MTEKIEQLYYDNGNIKIINYYLNGKLHKENGPACIEYYQNGNIKIINYYLNGKLHKDNGPAFIGYYENGNISHKWYYLNEHRHKENGPAYIEYFQNGNIEFEEYYLNDSNITDLYHEVKEILEQLSTQYPTKNDLELVFKLSYNDLYYQIFNIIRKENEND